MIYEPVEDDDADGEVDEVQEEMPVIVDAHTVINPGTVAGTR